jgi:hypothetical protein
VGDRDGGPKWQERDSEAKLSAAHLRARHTHTGFLKWQAHAVFLAFFCTCYTMPLSSRPSGWTLDGAEDWRCEHSMGCCWRPVAVLILPGEALLRGLWMVRAGKQVLHSHRYISYALPPTQSRCAIFRPSRA